MTVIPSGASPQLANGSTRQENWWEFLQHARRELKEAGAAFRSGDEIAAQMDEIRGEHERPSDIYWEEEWRTHHAGA